MIILFLKPVVHIDVHWVITQKCDCNQWLPKARHRLRQSVYFKYFGHIQESRVLSFITHELNKKAAIVLICNCKHISTIVLLNLIHFYIGAAKCKFEDILKCVETVALKCKLAIEFIDDGDAVFGAISNDDIDYIHFCVYVVSFCQLLEQFAITTLFELRQTSNRGFIGCFRFEGPLFLEWLIIMITI